MKKQLGSRLASWRPDSAVRQLRAASHLEGDFALMSAGAGLPSQRQQGSSCDAPLLIQDIIGGNCIGSACHLNSDTLCSQTSSQSIGQPLNILSTANHHNVCMKGQPDSQSG